MALRAKQNALRLVRGIGAPAARPGIVRIVDAALDVGWRLGVASTSAEPSVRAILEHVVGLERAVKEIGSDRVLYVATLRNGEASNFFGPVVSPEPVVLPLPLPAPEPAGAEATLTLTLQGLTAGARGDVLRLVLRTQPRSGTFARAATISRDAGRVQLCVTGRRLLSGALARRSNAPRSGAQSIALHIPE